MRTLLIVDDEKNIRLGLKAIIERRYPGAYDIRYAGDGEEALACLEAVRTDIVITDIRMPGMDGLELIRRAVALKPPPAVIILSGYDDFQYAREAIKYDVKEYLLKPIVREEMYAALQRAEQELSRREEISGRLGATERYRSELIAAQLNLLLVNADIGAAEIGERCRSLGLGEFEPLYFVGVLRFAGERSENVKAEEYLSRFREDGSHLHFEDRDGSLVIVAKNDAVYRGLADDLADRGAAAWYIGVSEPAADIGAIKDRYRQAKHALKYSLLMPRSRPALLRYEQFREREGPVQVPVDEIRKLANMLGTDREREMKALLVGLLDPGRDGHADIAYIEAVSRHLNELVFDKVFREYGEESVEILKLYKQVGSIYHFTDIHAYFHQVESLLFLLSDYIRSLRSAHAEHKEMKRAVQYIREHYSRDLNMAIVSNHVSLNYSYFSQLFKEYTGMSFIAYLKQVRIEKAKELLLRSDDKVYEVGEKVGFENAKQFNRVFRELEGVSAMEYRSSRAAVRALRGGE